MSDQTPGQQTGLNHVDHLSPEGKAVEAIVARLSQRDDCDVAEEIERAMAGLDINAPYNSSKHEEQNGEFMTVGHKLSLDIVHLAHRPATAKLEGIKAMLERGLDTNTTWREGRASGTVGATLLASVLWLQGITDDDKLNLARTLINRGLDVNSDSVERATKASVGTFVLAGAINCPSLQSQSKVSLLTMVLEAGLDLNSPCQQGKVKSTTGSTLGGRIATATGISPNHQIGMLLTLVRGGWRPLNLSPGDLTKLSSLSSLSRDPSLDPALLFELVQAIENCDSGDWTFAGGLSPVRAGPASSSACGQ